MALMYFSAIRKFTATMSPLIVASLDPFDHRMFSAALDFAEPR
jgi:hypothetical protein